MCSEMTLGLLSMVYDLKPVECRYLPVVTECVHNFKEMASSFGDNSLLHFQCVQCV